MEVNFTAHDFDRLTDTFAQFSDSLRHQDGRFECSECVGMCDCTPDGKYIYWFEHDWINVVFGREFIISQGFTCKVFFDIANHRSELSCNEYTRAGIQAPWIMLYAIVTDYSSPYMDKFLQY